MKTTIHKAQSRPFQLASKVNSACRLFSEISDANRTQLAFKAKFFPIRFIENQNLLYANIILGRRVFVLTKQHILDLVTDTMEEIFLPYPVSSLSQTQPFKIHWEYNCIPTEKEWNKISDDYKFRVDFRHLALSDVPYVAIIGNC